MDHALPDSASLQLRRTSTLSTSQYSTASSSSPEFTIDCARTPASEDGTVVPKIEELDEDVLQALDETKPATIVSGQVNFAPPRKRGRPRKHPIVEQKKPPHARSKTGCGTCRKRKKKCGEEKPFCTNCEKNNVHCDGYEQRQHWQSRKERSLSFRSLNAPAELPTLVSGVDGSVDQMFFQYFTGKLGHVLSITDHYNPYLEIIIPMAMSHTGLMHSLLYLSGSCLIASEPTGRWEWEQRREHHGSRAIRLLQEDLSESAIVDDDIDAENSKPIGDPSIAQTLILCLQSVCTGDLTGSYRVHLNGMKEMLTKHKRTFPNEQLRQFILEFLLYHDYGSSITNLDSRLDARSFSLMEDFNLPEFMIQPQAATLLGVLDGLFGFISRIRALRDQIRVRKNQGHGHWWDAPIMTDAFAIDNALRAWQCVHEPGTPRYLASLLYRQCTWIYLQRTIQISRANPMFQQAVDEGLGYLRLLPWDADSTQSILLMPLFLLGCAAFEPEQRPEISDALERLQAWSKLGNIKYARAIVEQVWQMMDEGREEETWDWETIIARRGWDFLVT